MTFKDVVAGTAEVAVQDWCNHCYNTQQDYKEPHPELPERIWGVKRAVKLSDQVEVHQNVWLTHNK